MAMSGNAVARADKDMFRAGLRMAIWLMLFFAFFGMFVRLAGTTFIWTTIAAIFLINAYFWERGQARQMITLAVLATGGSVQQLTTLSIYLRKECIGYWRRLGSRIDPARMEAPTWIGAVENAKLVRGNRMRVAINLLTLTGDQAFLQREMKESLEDRLRTSHWLSRLFAAGFSLLIVGIGGTIANVTLWRMLQSMTSEFHAEDPQLYTLLEQLGLTGYGWYIFLPLTFWSCMLLAYLAKTFPILQNWRPFSWFLWSAHRSLSLHALSHMFKSTQSASAACRSAALALPLTKWQHRMRSAADMIDQGVNLNDALYKLGLIQSRERAPLALCRSAHDLSWTLGEISTSVRERFFRNVDIAVQLLVLIIILLSAIVVLLISATLISMMSLWITEVAMPG